jgi:hypothetical protein
MVRGERRFYSGVAARLPPAESMPAIEYNGTSRIGALLGVRIIAIGHNTTATVTPPLALNVVF